MPIIVITDAKTGAVTSREMTAKEISRFKPTAQQLRQQRDVMLLDVDKLAGNVLRWASLDADTQSAWATYRQKLLDAPQQPSFPDTVEWPIKPRK